MIYGENTYTTCICGGGGNKTLTLERVLAVFNKDLESLLFCCKFLGSNNKT